MVDDADSSLLETLAGLAAPTMEGQAIKWTEALVRAIEAKIPALPVELQGLAVAALGKVRSSEGLLGETTAEGFTAIVTHLADGASDKARLVWLASDASFDADMSALDDAFAASQDARAKKAARWATVQDIGVSLLKAAGPAILPLLLSLI